jgi:hypothetical protein
MALRPNKLKCSLQWRAGMTPAKCPIATAVQYAIRKAQETNLGLNMNATQLACADDVNLIGDDTRTN